MHDLTSDQKKHLLEAFKQISDAYTLQETARDDIKDIIDSLVDAIPLDKKVVRKLARLHHRQKVHDFKTEADSVTELYDQLVKGKTSTDNSDEESAD